MVSLHATPPFTPTQAELVERARLNPATPHRARFIVCFRGREVAYLSFDLYEGREFMVLYDLYVIRDRRLEGIGSLALHTAEEYATNAGKRTLRLRPGETDDVPLAYLHQWYSRHGYHATPKDAGVMEKTL